MHHTADTLTVLQPWAECSMKRIAKHDPAIIIFGGTDSMRRRNEKVVKGRVEWRKQNEVKKLRIAMIIVAVFLCLSIAAGAIFAWLEVKKRAAPPASSAVPSSHVSTMFLPQCPENARTVKWIK